MNSPTFVVDNSFVCVKDLDVDSLNTIRTTLTYRDDTVYWERKRLLRLMAMGRSKGMPKLYHGAKDKLANLTEEIVCLFKDNKFPTGLFNLVLDTLATTYPERTYCLQDDRIKPDSTLILRPYFKHALRYYQKEASEAAVKAGRGVIESACGSGKTMILLDIIAKLKMNTLIIVPTAALLEQTGNDLTEAFSNKYVQDITTATIKADKSLKPIRIATIQTLTSLFKQGLIDKVVKDVDCLIIDEFQFAGAKSYTELMRHMSHVFYRFGFTGSFTRQTKLMDMYGVLSNVVYNYSPKKATEEGYLTPLNYNIIKLPGQRKLDYTKEYRQNYEGNPIVMSAIKNLIEEIPKEESILILVERKEKMGNMLHEYLANLGIESSWISGDNSKEEIVEQIEAFNDGKLRILIGSAVIGVGVDIRATNNLILARGGKSEVNFVQGVGRAARLYPNKHVANVYDFSFEYTKYLNKHLKERLEIFKAYFNGEVQVFDFKN